MSADVHSPPPGLAAVVDPSNVDAGHNLSAAAAAVLPDQHMPALPAGYQAGLITLYGVTTTMAVTGNLVVIAVLAVGRRSRTELRCFLLSLAVADLTMAVFCMPFTFTTTMLHNWVFGAPMCTAVLFMQMLSVTASVGTSTAIAVNRCRAVTRPLRPRDDRRSRLTTIGAIWIVSTILSSIQLVVGRTAEVPGRGGDGDATSSTLNLTVCSEAWPGGDAADTWRTGYTFFVLLTTYIVPLAAIGPAYACVARRLWNRQAPGSSIPARDRHQLRSKRRVIKMLTVMVGLFAVCWLPLHVFTVVVDFVPQLRNEDHAEADGIVIAVYTTVHWLAMSNSFVNPIVYGFLNDNFRYDLRSMSTGLCEFVCPTAVGRRCCAQGRLDIDDLSPAVNCSPPVLFDSPMVLKERAADEGAVDGLRLITETDRTKDDVSPVLRRDGRRNRYR